MVPLMKKIHSNPTLITIGSDKNLRACVIKRYYSNQLEYGLRNELARFMNKKVVLLCIDKLNEHLIL